MWSASVLLRLVVCRLALVCSPCLLSLLHLPVPSLSLPQLPWLHPLCLHCSAFYSLLSPFCPHYPFHFIPGSVDLLSAHIGTESLHACICAPVYVCVGGGYCLNFITRSLDHTHLIRLWPFSIATENKRLRQKLITQQMMWSAFAMSWSLPGYLLLCVQAGRDTWALDLLAGSQTRSLEAPPAER